MKKKLLFIALVFLGGACSDEVIEEYNGKAPATRSVIDEPSTSNPQLLTDWEHQDEILLCSGNRISTPWATSSSIVSNMEFANDIKKEDGWIMLFHTFRGLNYYPNVNYIILYNELTGFIKIFYYNQGIFGGTNGALWYFNSMNGTGTSLFNLNSYIALPDNAPTKNSFVSLSNALTNPANGFQFGWNGFEMEVPYTKDYLNTLFSVSTYNNSVTSYVLSGTTESTIEGTIVKTMSANNGIFKAISTIGGAGAKSLVGKLKTKADNGLAADTTGTVKAKLGTKIVNLLSKASSGDFASVILGGLKSIFGSSMVTETQQVHLTSNGTIDLKGSSINVSSGAAYPIGNLNWYDIANTHNSVMGGRYLGVWTLKSDPIIRISRYSRITDNIIQSNAIQQGTLYGPYLLGSPELNIEFNPNLTPYITQKSISTEIVCCEMLNGERFGNTFFSQYVDAPLIYSDRSMRLVETPINSFYYNTPVVRGYYVPKFYDYYYDWGTNFEENNLLIVTVDLSYNYKGKTHKIISSRTYRPKCIVDESMNLQILKSGKNRNAYIVNTGEYPLE